jgi:hypothetical protein
MMTPFSQVSWACRCEWGMGAVAAVGARASTHSPQNRTSKGPLVFGASFRRPTELESRSQPRKRLLYFLQVRSGTLEP